jgi:Tfp pilus assembly protein PilZ
MPRVCVAKIALPSRVEISAEVANLTEGSVFIKTTEPLSFGEHVELTLFEVTVPATVAFVSDEPRGVVLSFGEPPEVMYDALAKNAEDIDVLLPSYVDRRDPWADGTDPQTEPGLSAIDINDGHDTTDAPQAFDASDPSVTQEDPHGRDEDPATIAVSAIQDEPEIDISEPAPEPPLELEAMHLDILPPEDELPLIIEPPRQVLIPDPPRIAPVPPMHTPVSNAALALARASSGARLRQVGPPGSPPMSTVPKSPTPANLQALGAMLEEMEKDLSLPASLASAQPISVQQTSGPQIRSRTPSVVASGLPAPSPRVASAVHMPPPRPAPAPAPDLPHLEGDGVTLRFASAEQYKSQYKANVAHGGIIVRATPLPIGTQKFLGIEIPGRERYTVSARVTFIGEGTVGFVIDSFPIHKAQLRNFAEA